MEEETNNDSEEGTSNDLNDATREETQNESITFSSLVSIFCLINFSTK